MNARAHERVHVQNINQMVAFFKRLGLRETNHRFFPRKRVPGPNDFFFFV